MITLQLRRLLNKPMKPKNILSPKTRLVVSFFFTIVLYSLGYLAHFELIQFFSGIFLLYYFPGKFIIEIIPALANSFQIYGRISLSIMYSFLLSNLLALAIQNHFGFNSGHQILALLVLNLTLYLSFLIINKKRSRKEKILSDENVCNFIDLIPFFILFCAFLAITLMNPLAQNYDHCLSALKESMINNTNAFGYRQIFLSSLGLAHHFLGLSIQLIYRNLFNIIFLSSTLICLDYLNRNIKASSLKFFLFLTFLIPPVILIQLNYIIPQVGIIVVTIPVLILLVESMKNRNITYLLAAIAISMIALMYHQLGIVLLITSITTLLLFINYKKVNWKYIIVGIIILAPYLYTLRHLSFISPTITMAKYVASTFSGIRWTFWFLNSYKDVDGNILNFTGINLVLFYLFNGLAVIILLIFFYLRLVQDKVRIKAYILPPLIYSSFFLIVAELFPRLGFVFLPTRAWIHMIIAGIILLILLIEHVEKNHSMKFIPYVFAPLVIVGFIGTMYLTKNNIRKIYKEEMPIANFIKNNTEKNAFFLSSQDNMAIIDIYGERNFYIQLNINQKEDRDHFDKLTTNQINLLSEDKISIVKPKVVQTTEVFNNNLLVEKRVSVIQEQTTKKELAIYKENNPVYFIYSKRKLNNLNSAKMDSQFLTDSLNKDNYDTLGYPVVYKDDNTLLIKIR